MNGPDMANRLITEKELAAYFNLSLSTLRQDRHNERGAPYIKLGSGTIRYRLADVEAYLVQKTITPGETA